ncbi:hypothetical protein [Legionella sp. PC997]|uniref:hypothetical protein n=1 Tax=Legionella sp. PC997 TaxID=2755562 RepID=UPI0015FB4A93|nr:hypothetical protein [Legionella sp. PC997]QMT60731.1 hypothetical protein HBNCFIEN_02115 [Legionella sp. PC997]
MPIPNSFSVRNNAAEIQVAYNLTQEPFTFGTLRPNRNFSPRERGALGAFQLIARWSQLAMDNNIFSYFITEGEQTNYTFADPRLSVQRANTWGIGIIVIMTDMIKLTF